MTRAALLRSRLSQPIMGLLVLLSIASALRTWVVTPLIICGPSMLPTYHDRQFAFLNKLSYRCGPPQRGDVVCVWTGTELFAKRVVGLPGEKVAIREGIVYIEGQPLLEPYVKSRSIWNMSPGRLGARIYLVVGDNRSLPQSQAVLAVVTRDRIVGKVLPTRRDWAVGRTPTISPAPRSR